MKHKCDVLVMIWDINGRDAEALIPIIYLLREKYNLNVQIRSIFETSSIDLLKPKVLLTNGCNGARETYRATKYAKERGVYVVAQHAEGIFVKALMEIKAIGWNEDRKPTVHKWFMWNQNAYDWTVDLYPQFKNVLEVAGSVLHEKYRIFEASDFELLKRLKHKYSKVIFYPGWATFEQSQALYNEGKIKTDPSIEKNYVISMLKAIASNYPDCLLVLKRHPNTVNEMETEIGNYFDDFDNVTVFYDEHPLYELIMISDLIITYDSTTTMDAWLADKTTINLYRGNVSIYPNDSYGFSDMREGSLVPEDKSQLLSYIDEFFKNGKISEFEKKKSVRQRVIELYINDISKKPSLKVAEHVFNSIDKKVEKIRRCDWGYFLTGIISRIIYHFKFIPLSVVPFRFKNMRRYYKKDGFQIKYNNYSEKLKQYYSI